MLTFGRRHLVHLDLRGNGLESICNVNRLSALEHLDLSESTVV